ncbi:glycosyltransferase involved in cell wall biosynthesis [Rhodoblastus acidophilus]|uniref:glycosyltransferase n=1 Tax=Rhodoblastus acidophilus TaxID=1074 RepID=UPI002225A6E1|nr:glycosyltransferase family 4 protein [Rhodoblastus acidophilus]MCW2282995.1 glycosyltransferase involved in cell wall biosynthesis [Rhodoblastus acidophilus]MCW2331954.1 glycosyltransferase involved in cell wall biosynthesis [Rhodoblastus acidophilus]
MTDPVPAWFGFDVLVVSPTPTHPQDHGNRKRIYEICAELKRQGARIHFVHYPAEHDWRDQWPLRHEADMRAAWDSYQLVAPGRELHCDSIGEDHEIDEWADPGLAHYLAWACRVRAYDMVIVNYTWLSFCLDAIPASVFKVCDTHDVFADRRRLLQAHGIAPEFFHTTRDEEARGLARADLVWAIKKGEQDYFERDLGLPNCLTMLHAEPERGWWSAPPSTDGWLRAGVIGARNNVNRRNLEEFLNLALPAIERYMAPVKIVIAGGCSADFLDWRHPNLEVVGRVPDVADFYRAVDVVLAPMKFSTGLKIKVSEALASGAPLLAHAHAMEGYPTREPLHQLHDFEEMAIELVKLAFDPAPLKKLAARSRTVCATIQASVLASVEATRARLVAKTAETICVVAPAEALNPACLLHDHLLEALDYLRFIAPIALHVSGAPVKGMKFDFLARFELRRQIFADPALVAALGDDAPDFWTPIPLPALLETRAYRRAYFLADASAQLRVEQPAFDEAAGAIGALRRAVVRCDAIELSGGDPAALVELLRGEADVIVAGAAPWGLQHWQGQKGVLAVVEAPFRRSGAFEAFRHRDKPATAAKLVIFARGDDPVALELAALAEKLSFPARLVDVSDPAIRPALLRGGPNDALAGLREASLVVDMTEQDALALVIGEAALRSDVPVLSFQRGALAYAWRGFETPLRPTSLARLFTAVATCAQDPDALQALRGASARQSKVRFANDAGWTALWRLLTAKSVESLGAAAELWG